jgi:serine/threonine-protein kinase
LDVGILDGVMPYMVLEFLNGVDLSKLLEQRQWLHPREVVDHVAQALEAIAHAHALGIVHRDLKPANLFLARRSDGTERIKVLDFGISKVLGPANAANNMTRTNAMMGTPLYMAPEQLRNAKSVDHRCDIWALGVITYELLSGRPPFLADNAVALFAAIQEAEPPSLQSLRQGTIPPALEAAVLRCVRRVPEERYESVTQFAEAIAPFGSDVALRSLENARRILPLPAGRRAAPIAVATPAASRPVASERIAAESSTAEPWSSSPPRAVRKTSSGVMAALAGALVLAVVLVMVIAMKLRLPQEKGTSSALGSTTSTPAVTAAAGTPTIPAAVVIASAPTPTTSPLIVASAAPPTVEAAAGREVSKPRPKATTPTASVSKPPAANCNPPYEFDAKGDKRWKAECL